MATKTWEEIKAGNMPAARTFEFGKAGFTGLCDSWGQVPVGRGFQYVFCRREAGHKGLHAGMQDPNTRIGWT